MRTKIAATWIVAHERGKHVLDSRRGGRVRGQQDPACRQGLRRPRGQDHRCPGKLVAPGFIDTHVHSGHRASHRLITDTGRPMYYGQPFLEISVPKEGKVVKGDPRYLKHGDKGSAAAFELNAAFTVAELLRNGVTTFVEYGSQLERAGRVAGRGDAARRARLSGARLRLRPLGGRRGRTSRARAQRRVSAARDSRRRAHGSRRTTARPTAACAASSSPGRSRRPASRFCR